MAISKELQAAARAGDVDEVERCLAALDASALVDVFNFSFTLGEQPELALRLLYWVALQERPTESDVAETAWLRAMNNGVNIAIRHGERDVRLNLVRRAMEHAPENVAIYHNAACVYCALGLADDAMDAVVGAVEHDYKSIAQMAEDEDLDVIRHHPGFVALIESGQADQKERLERNLALVSEQVLRGAEVPRELQRMWRGSLAEHSAPHVRALLVRRPAEDRFADLRADVELGPAWRRLLAATDWVAETRVGWLGYLRGADGKGALETAPLLHLSPNGDLRVSASIFDSLLLMVDDLDVAFGRDLTFFKMYLNNIGEGRHVVDVDAARTRARAAETQVAQWMRSAVDDGSLVASEWARNLARDARSIKSPGEPTTTVYLMDALPLPWVAGAITRIGGPPVGVGSTTRPRFTFVDGREAPMAHLVTIDLDQVPTLRHVEMLRERPEVRALSVFISDARLNEAYEDGDETRLVLLTDDDIEREGEWRGPVVADPPRRTMVLTEVAVPTRLFGSRDSLSEDGEPSEAAVHDALMSATRVGGKAILWSGEEHASGEFLMQLDESIVDVNLGDAGTLYVFSDAIWWTSH